MAEKYDLMVLMGINLQKQLHGFDYNDEMAVEQQFESVKEQIFAYKEHPNLLGWIVANEPNLLFDESGELADVNPKVYDEINRIIEFIHEVDPHHPVTYIFSGTHKSHIQTAISRTPSVDIISVQIYGELDDLAQAIEDIGIDKPYMVTEFGPTGHWEMPATLWGREIEELSGVKAARLAERLENAFATNPMGSNYWTLCVLLGPKTRTYANLVWDFDKDGRANARLNEMTRFWTGSYPKH